MATVEVYSNLDDLAALSEEWSALAQVDPRATPFQTPEWLLSWATLYAPSNPQIIVIRDGADLVGLFPLMRGRSPWQPLRPMGLGPSDYLHPLLADSHYADDLWSVVDDLGKGGLVDLHQVRETNPLVRNQTIHQATCLVLDLPASYDDYVKSLGKSLRYDVKRFDKLSVNLRFADSGSLRADLEIFFNLHTARWRQRFLPGAFVGNRIKEFHLQWGRRALLKGMLWLGILEHEGHPVGGIYVMRHRETAFFYQAGFDPSAKALSPGSLLVSQLIKRSIEEGLTTFDFLRGDEPYKRRWQPQHELKNLRLLVSNGPIGELGARWNLVASRVEEGIRKKLEG